MSRRRTGAIAIGVGAATAVVLSLAGAKTSVVIGSFAALAIAAALSLLPLGQPLLVGTAGITTATTAVLLQAAPVFAQDASAVARIAKAITIRIEPASDPGSGVIVKKEGNRYRVLTAWHVVSGNQPGEELAIFTNDGKEHQLKQGSIERLGKVDIAVLTFSSHGSYGDID